MALEGAGWREKERHLPYSDADVSTHFLGSYHGSFKVRDDKTIPPSMNIKDHIFSMAGLYIGMEDAVEMIGEKLEEPALEEAIAVSGLKEHIASMTPQPGGSILNRELNALFLAPTTELKPYKPISRRFYGRPDFKGPIHPLVALGVHYGRAEISVYDFPAMVSYAVSNTALQHTVNIASGGRPQNVDPRLALIELCQEESVVA